LPANIVVIGLQLRECLHPAVRSQYKNWTLASSASPIRPPIQTNASATAVERDDAQCGSGMMRWCRARCGCGGAAMRNGSGGVGAGGACQRGGCRSPLPARSLPTQERRSSSGRGRVRAWRSLPAGGAIGGGLPLPTGFPTQANGGAPSGVHGKQLLEVEDDQRMWRAPSGYVAIGI